jgi:predicted 3-demethylubiquinone-9 3-methyltransferase (glyoxalase superfamily)
MSSNITPCLWFESSAEEAAKFYCETFQNSFIIDSSNVSVNFSLNNREYIAMNGSPGIKINNTTSFSVYCGSDQEIQRLYDVLLDGGEIMMPLGPYPWARKYAWVQDKFGVSWQLDVDPINNPQNIVPSVMFVNKHATKLKEAITFYHEIFPKPHLLFQMAYPPEMQMPVGSLRFAQHKLNGYIFNFMSSHEKHEWEVNEGVSFIISCQDQDEIDHYWNSLIAQGGKPRKFGWLKDKYGITWQVLPINLGDLLKIEGNLEKLIKMDKIRLSELN